MGSLKERSQINGRMHKEIKFIIGTVVMVLFGIGCQSSGSGSGIVTDLYEGADSSDPNGMFIFKNELYMQMTTEDLGSEIFKYDGSEIINVTDIAGS